MKAAGAARTEDLARRLEEAEATIQALLSGQIDAVVDPRNHAPVLLFEAQEALRRSEERYRRIVETTNQGVWTLDLRGRTTFMNTRMASMLGYEASEVVGVSVVAFVAEEGRAKALRNVERGRVRALQVESQLKRKDGSTFWALLDVSPTLSESGTSEGQFAMVMDVTERKKSEEALRASELSALSLEAQLRQAQKMEAIGRLAGGVAHDFNNLLSVVLSYSELLAADLKEGDPMRGDLEEIRGAGLRAVDLTRQLLAFSRQQVLQPRVVDLNEIVGGMEKMLRRLIGEDVQLIVACPPGLGNITVDPGQVEQVLMNLAVNARDAMPRGGKLTIETAEVVHDETYAREHEGAKLGPHLVIRVSDTGTGMDKATLARIFEPFFTTKGAGIGTGLGLATAFGIVRQSGGTIAVRSEPGKGSTFEVFFPMADRAAAVVRPVLALPGPRVLQGSETILLVEDEERVRVLARAILRKYGYNVLEAQNGGEAFLMCEQYEGTIELLLTDVVMPRMSGRQLAERLLALRPRMKVLYMSGYTDDAVVRHGITDSSVGFLQKPITPDALARKVREVLGATRAA